MTNQLRTVVYIGVTSDLRTRVLQHKDHYFKGSFTDKITVQFVFTMKILVELKRP